MAQFDVYANPIRVARPAYPYVVILQSHLADVGRERIVAPLAPRESLAALAGRLTPFVRLGDAEYVVIVPGLAGIPSKDLREAAGSLAGYRSEILAGVDYLFFGV